MYLSSLHPLTIVACALDYEEESPSVHRRFSSTPAHTKTLPLSHMTSPFTDQSRKQEQKLSEMASQLEKLQVMSCLCFDHVQYYTLRSMYVASYMYAIVL